MAPVEPITNTFIIWYLSFDGISRIRLARRSEPPLRGILTKISLAPPPAKEKAEIEKKPNDRQYSPRAKSKPNAAAVGCFGVLREAGWRVRRISQCS